MNEDMFKSLWWLVVGVGLIIISILSEGWAIYFNIIVGLISVVYAYIKGRKYL